MPYHHTVMNRSSWQPEEITIADYRYDTLEHNNYRKCTMWHPDLTYYWKVSIGSFYLSCFLNFCDTFSNKTSQHGVLIFYLWAPPIYIIKILGTGSKSISCSFTNRSCPRDSYRRGEGDENYSNVWCYRYGSQGNSYVHVCKLFILSRVIISNKLHNFFVVSWMNANEYGKDKFEFIPIFFL